jgi:hypothetical protein
LRLRQNRLRAGLLAGMREKSPPRRTGYDPA